MLRPFYQFKRGVAAFMNETRMSPMADSSFLLNLWMSLLLQSDFEELL